MVRPVNRAAAFHLNRADADDDERAVSIAATFIADHSAVSQLNHAPSGADATREIAESTRYILATSDFGFSDPEGDAFAAIVLGEPINGLLYLDTDGFGGLAPVALTSPATVAVSEIAAGHLSFIPYDFYVGPDAASISFSVVDSGGASDPSGNTLTFDIAHNNQGVFGGPFVNDAPVVSAGADASAGEDMVTALTGVRVSDPDAGTAPVSVILHVDHGTIAIRTDVAGGISAAAGNGSATISITGSQDQINTTLAALNGLTYTPAADFDGTDGLVITANDLGSTRYAVDFAAAAPTPSSAGPESIITFDYNGDGKLDLAYVLPGLDEVGVKLGNGDGTFQPEVAYGVGDDPQGIVAADVNGDGRLDLVVANHAGGAGSGSVGILYGNSSGTFDSHATIISAGAVPYAAGLVVGDFNGDGLSDIAIADRDDSRVAVSLQDAGAPGTWNAPMFSDAAIADTYVTVGVAAGDFDGDGKLDLIALNGFEPYPTSITFLKGDGAGAFAAPLQLYISASDAPTGVAVADLDGDGDLDIVFSVANSAGPGFVTIILNNGDGTFDPASQMALPLGFGGPATGVAVADVNDDGRPDLIVTGHGQLPNESGSALVLLGNGDGAFQPAVGLGAGKRSESVAAGDFNGDGFTDLAVANPGDGTISILGNARVALTDTGTKAILIVPANDAPAGNDATIAGDEDAPHIFQLADFGFSDADTGDALSAVRFGAVTGGKLYFDDNGGGGADRVEIADFPATFAAGDIDAGKLSFVPTADLSGAGAGSIAFQVIDGSGAANDIDLSANILTIDLNPVDDAPVAQPDDLATFENATVSGSLFADHGHGPDIDVDSPSLMVSAVNGIGSDVGGKIVLASGALLTVNGDGTYDYDPNGAFDSLTSTASGETGAVNISAVDSFTYTVTGGNMVTVEVTVNGLVSAEDRLEGDGTDNVVTGTGNGDHFDLSQGGADMASGLGGDDGFFFGGAFTADDRVDGGGGANDQIGLQGDYTGANILVLGPNTIANVEAIVVLPGYSYDIVTDDGNVAAGGVLKVQATQLVAGQSLHFDGSAESDGTFMIYGGQGDDDLTGGAGNDGFYFGPGGFNSGDIVNGGTGTNDQLALDGDYTITLGGNVTNVEVLVLLHGPTATPNRFDITSGDAFASAGQTMTIFGLQVTTDIVFDGSGEHDGAFKIYGGGGGDVLTGSDGDDWIFGGGGGDTLTGGLGSDIFYYDDAGQSTSLGFDKIVGLDDSVDRIDLPFAVTGFAGPASGDLSTGSFDSQLGTAFAGLTSHQAGLFTATGGDMSGRIFLVVDADGNAGYQAGSDYVIEIVSSATPVDNPALFI